MLSKLSQRIAQAVLILLAAILFAGVLSGDVEAAAPYVATACIGAAAALPVVGCE